MVADEVGVYHCVQRVVRRAFLCGVDPLSDKSYDYRRSWIRDRLESLAEFFGVEIAAFGARWAGTFGATLNLRWGHWAGPQRRSRRPKRAA